MKPHKCPLVPKRCSEDLQRAVTGCTMAAESPARAQAQGPVFRVDGSGL